MYARFCLCPPRVESLFPQVLLKSYNQIPLALPGQSPWGIPVPLLGPQARSLTCSSKPSQQWENFFCIIVLHFVGYPPAGYRIWFYHDCAPPTISCSFFFVFGHGVSFFGRFQSPPVCGCSTSSCDFGAFAGGDEQNLILLHLETEALDMLPFTCRSLFGCDSQRPSPIWVWFQVCLFNFSACLLVMTLSSIWLSIHVKYYSSENRISVSNTKFNSDSLPACLVTKMYPVLCNPMDCSLPGSSVHRFPRQKYGNALPYPRNLPDPGSNLTCLHLLHWKPDSLPLATIPQKRKLVLNKDFSKYKQRTISTWKGVQHH